MKKALIVATVGGFITCFEKNDIKLLQSMGCEVHVACDVQDQLEALQQTGAVVHDIPFARSPFSRKNLAAYRALKQVMEETAFSLVHCHTPVGGVLARLVAGRYRKSGCKVIYTAHGFHFFKGASKKNWMIFYPVEKLLARRTDVLITINQEDYIRAGAKLRAGRVEYIPGVGIDTDRFHRTAARDSLRNESGCDKENIVVLSVGELSRRKNQELVIRAISRIGNSNIRYYIAGRGALKEEMERLIEELNLQEQVKLLGQRSDISALCEMADIFAFPSLQEGLPVSLMEAMAMELPCVVSDIRGNTDLIREGRGGFLCKPYDKEAFAQAIARLASDKELRETFGRENRERIADFSLPVVEEKMKTVYEGLL